MVRLFGRIKALKNILTALTASIVPVINAFLIMLVIAAICELRSEKMGWGGQLLHSSRASDLRSSLTMAHWAETANRTQPDSRLSMQVHIALASRGVQRAALLANTLTQIPAILLRCTPAIRADSIMGVTFYSDDAPAEFGKFDRALITMYRLTAGDTWVSNSPFASHPRPSPPDPIFPTPPFH